MQNCANLVYKHEKGIFVITKYSWTPLDIDTFLILKKKFASSQADKDAMTYLSERISISQFQFNGLKKCLSDAIKTL